MKKPATSKLLTIIALAVAVVLGYSQKDSDLINGFIPSGPNSDQAFADAYQNWTSDIQLEGSGTVVAVLPDDLQGSRHQRFIVELASGQTIMIAHNIDLAPKITSLTKGDNVSFYGEYEWNDRGGVIHWTHDDPRGSHPDGWIKHAGRIYQ